MPKAAANSEILLLEENAVNDWWVMLRPGKRARIDTEIILRDLVSNAATVRAKVTATNEEATAASPSPASPIFVIFLTCSAKSATSLHRPR